MSENTEYSTYRSRVQKDFNEAKRQFPFSMLTFPPTSQPTPALIRMLAVDKELIDRVLGQKEDFLGDYSKELFIEVPFDYLQNGCRVFGGRWIDLEQLQEKDKHFHTNKHRIIVDSENGYLLCTGVPESFSHMKNVILESAKTASNMLIAYERIMRGETAELEFLKSYSHGDAGKEEYRFDRRRYIK